MKKAEKQLKDYNDNGADLFAEYILPEEVSEIVSKYGGDPKATVKVLRYKEENPKTGRARNVYENSSLSEAVAHSINNAVINYFFESSKQLASRPPPYQLYDVWKKINEDCLALLSSLYMRDGGPLQIPLPLLQDWAENYRGVPNARDMLNEVYQSLLYVAIGSRHIAAKHKRIMDNQRGRRPPDIAKANFLKSLFDIKKKYLSRGKQEDFVLDVLRKTRGICIQISSQEALVKCVRRRH